MPQFTVGYNSLNVVIGIVSADNVPSSVSKGFFFVNQISVFAMTSASISTSRGR